jgi:hypothetical protein
MRAIMKNLALCAILLYIIATGAIGQEVSVNYNQSQSFADYHTYAWGSGNANEIKDSILSQVAKQSVDSALQEKGLRQVNEGQNPDLIVTSNGGMKQETSYTAMGMGGFGRFGGGFGTITPEQNVVGTLIVDLYAAKNKALVWRGVAQDTLNHNGDKNQKMVQKAVEKMFKKWPK